MPDRSVETLTLWRAFVPQWAFAPLSGEGAARFGGRWTASPEALNFPVLPAVRLWQEPGGSDRQQWRSAL
jgi:hypothetical protein